MAIEIKELIIRAVVEGQSEIPNDKADQMNEPKQVNQMKSYLESIMKGMQTENER